jgi:shikimate dehydrogenase
LQHKKFNNNMHPIDGLTEIIAHIGYPTHSFKAPLIYNPYFAARGINAAVVPFAVEGIDYPDFIRSLFRAKNIRGALITMPHKVSTTALADHLTPTARIAGSAHALKRDEQGALVADMFDGEGFVRGIVRKGFTTAGAKALVVGSGGVGSAIAASLAKAGVGELSVADTNASSALALCARLRENYPSLKARVTANDPTGFDLIVNATPLGMNATDPLPFDVDKIAAATFVGEVVMTQTMTPLLQAAAARGCAYQIGTDMLFEMIPAYLEFFGFPTTTPEILRELAQLPS